jgi:uncharacterized OsmC-like protein
MSESATVTLTQPNRDASPFQFTVDFDGRAQVRSDEPPPLGVGDGPTPQHFLLAAVANCLSASLTFALGKFKNDTGGLTTTARSEVGRNAENRLRVLKIDVEIRLGRPAADFEHLARVLGQFESFCTVSQSVAAGIPITVQVLDSTGARLN